MLAAGSSRHLEQLLPRLVHLLFAAGARVALHPEVLEELLEGIERVLVVAVRVHELPERLIHDLLVLRPLRLLLTQVLAARCASHLEELLLGLIALVGGVLDLSRASLVRHDVVVGIVCAIEERVEGRHGCLASAVRGHELHESVVSLGHVGWRLRRQVCAARRARGLEQTPPCSLLGVQHLLGLALAGALLVTLCRILLGPEVLEEILESAQRLLIVAVRRHEVLESLVRCHLVPRSARREVRAARRARHLQQLLFGRLFALGCAGGYRGSVSKQHHELVEGLEGLCVISIGQQKRVGHARGK
mmetsp:Transcript_7492/g.20435  ORF Transcript_7492/g.20435 Transcript_7492/m.20435 type:complete len:304 (-) Transcript_7492:83-994(-)